MKMYCVTYQMKGDFIRNSNMLSNIAFQMKYENLLFCYYVFIKLVYIGNISFIAFQMKYGNSLFCYYVFIKLVYIGNIVFQLFFLSSFFGMEGFLTLIIHSYQVVYRVATEQIWEHSRSVTHCW